MVKRTKKTKYLFVTGGVVSSLGKGLAAASIGALLENRGLEVTHLKLDPYINVDPGTMSPFQHGDARDALLWKVDGLSEYDVRRPLVPTGTNLLGLVKHVSSVAVGYFGDALAHREHLERVHHKCVQDEEEALRDHQDRDHVGHHVAELAAILEDHDGGVSG